MCGHSCGCRNRRGHRRGRRRGFSFDIFLTKMLFDVISNAFYLLNPQNNFNIVLTRNNYNICKQVRKGKKRNWKIEKVNVLLINMPLNGREYKIQFLERGNYRKF